MEEIQESRTRATPKQRSRVGLYYHEEGAKYPNLGVTSSHDTYSILRLTRMNVERYRGDELT